MNKFRLVKYVLEYSHWYNRNVYRLTIAGEYTPNTYYPSFAFTMSEAINNINAMRRNQTK